MLIMLFSIFAVIAMRSDAKQCYITQGPPCNNYQCGKWCYEKYNKGRGTCVPLDPDPAHPTYICACRYICSN
jgi:hypothetical protein